MPAVPAPGEITRLLDDVADGRPEAREALLAVVYDELRVLARAALRRERTDHTLGATELVHEAYLRLAEHAPGTWQNRSHFFAVAAQAMRRTLVDWARARLAAKRGAGVAPVTLEGLEEVIPAEAQAEQVLALDEALGRLEQLSTRQARVVECRHLAGLTIEETAEALGVSPSTVKQDWTLARAWLYRELGT
ncbi:MAG TPA: sigma-70 family RNA polymerase sigma factor [Rhodothermales bacterium]|nr:sigma-70 family RNA polymerase sigma factor [Rhodothermales bacterium]